MLQVAVQSQHSAIRHSSRASGGLQARPEGRLGCSRRSCHRLGLSSCRSLGLGLLPKQIVMTADGHDRHQEYVQASKSGTCSRTKANKPLTHKRSPLLIITARWLLRSWPWYYPWLVHKGDEHTKQPVLLPSNCAWRRSTKRCTFCNACCPAEIA